MAWFRRYPLIVLFGAVAALLLVVVALEAAFGPDRGSLAALGTPKAGAAGDTKLLPPIAAVSPEQVYPETAERPLFTPTRRRSPEAPAAAQNTFTPGQFTLQGVIIVGDQRVAMLREKSTGRIFRVERGKEINGIKVAEIEPEQVRLELGAQAESVPLTVQKGAGTPAAPAASGPFPTTAAAPVPQAPPMPQPGSGSGFPAPGGANPPPASGFPVTPLQGAANPGQTVLPQATPSSPLTPEELLARRRARRAQQNQ
jgi:hypothetical protein